MNSRVQRHPESEAAASLMNAFAQLLPSPSTSWSLSHLMKVSLGAIQTHARSLCIAPVRLEGFCSSGYPLGTGASRGCRCGRERRCCRWPWSWCPVWAQDASWSEPAPPCRAPRTSASPERCQGHSPTSAAHRTIPIPGVFCIQTPCGQS